MSSSKEDDQEKLVPPEFRPSKVRWYILFLTGLMGMVQSLVWMGWGTVAQSMYYAYPNWDDSDIGLLGNWGEIMFLVFSVPATWLIETYGARVGSLLCSALILLGTGLRCLQWMFLDHPDSGFIFKILAHTCGVINGSMGPFSVTIPSVVSSAWFPPHQRTMATGLSWLLLESGNALGFIIGPLMVSDVPANGTAHFNSTMDNSTSVEQIRIEVMYFMTLHAGMAALAFLLIVLYYPARPAILPSFTAGEKREDFLPGLKAFLSNRDAVLVTIAFAISQGIPEAFYPVFDLDFAPIGVSETTTGYIGFISAVAGSISAFFFSFVAEKVKGSYRKLILACLTVSFAFYCWQGLLVMEVIPFSLPQLYISSVASCSINFACTPLFLELGGEVAYPVGEGVVSGVMTFFWTVVGIIYLCMFFFRNIGYTWMNWTVMAGMLVSLPFVVCIRERFNRTDIDNNNEIGFSRETIK